MDYLTKQANLYGLSIKVIKNCSDRISHYNVVDKEGKTLASIYDTNEAYWLQREDNFMSSLRSSKELLVVK